MKTTWEPRDNSGRIWVTFGGCQFAATPVTEDLIDEIERLQAIVDATQYDDGVIRIDEAARTEVVE